MDRIFALTGWRYYALCLILGAIGILGHAPFHLWPITLLMFAVLIRALKAAETPKRAFRTGLVVGLGYFMGGIHWVGSAFIARGPEFIPVMPPMILGLALILARVS